MNFTQEELIDIIERSTRINKFFTRFFPQKRTHLVHELKIQIKKGKKKMAPFVAERVGGKILTREGFSEVTITTPKLAPSRPITIDDISKRILGEDIYSKKTPQQRAMEIFAKDLTDLEDSISNRVEWMARSIILGEEIIVVDEEDGVDLRIDFNFTNKELLITGAKWTDETSDPIADLRRWKKFVTKKSGVSANICIMGENAWNSFSNHEKVQNVLNNRRINIGEITPVIEDDALTFEAKINGIQIYTYDEWFLDDDGNEQAMLPLNTVLLLPNELGKIEYGCVTIMDRDEEFKTYESEIIPVIDADRKNHTKEITLISRPLPTPIDVDGWYVAKVCD